MKILQISGLSKGNVYSCHLHIEYGIVAIIVGLILLCG